MLRHSLLCLSVFALAATAQAQEDGCSLEGVVLDCGTGEPGAVLEAFAAPQTADLLNRPLDFLERFSRPSDIEKFRISLEKAWRTANRAERRERGRMLRRQISAAEFETWSQTYDQALKNYASGITFYRTLTWHGKTGKAPPADD